MSNELSQEIPLVFDCQGETLAGIVHKPLAPLSTGIVSVIAGGPQYRAGVGRNMVSMARELSAKGVPVMRFDHRGLGDSSGVFAGFEHIGADIAAAVECLKREVPQVKHVVLWGGCDAASGCMIHGCDIEGVGSMVLGNPWVTTAEAHSAVQQQHYMSRLGQWSFWRKLLFLEYNLVDYVKAGMTKLWSRLVRVFERGNDSCEEDTNSHWLTRMLHGLQKFDGPILFLMSGQSLSSKEFDQLVSLDKDWDEAYGRKVHKRIDLPDADQTFSSGDSRQRVNTALMEWVVAVSKN